MAASDGLAAIPGSLLQGSNAFEIKLVHAPGDGVAPAVLVSVAPSRKGPEYLFNAPEGFPRLVLEHKCRPSARLRAVFATSCQQQSLGGFAGLMMRLKADGHDKIDLFGPPGTIRAVHALRHFTTWLHPKVYATEVAGSGPAVIYQDDFVEVRPLFITSAGAQASAANGSSTKPGKPQQLPVTADANSMVAKPAMLAAKGPALFAQLDAAFGQDSAAGGRRNALQLLRASKAAAAPAAASQHLPGSVSSNGVTDAMPAQTKAAEEVALDPVAMRRLEGHNSVFVPQSWRQQPVKDQKQLIWGYTLQSKSSGATFVIVDFAACQELRALPDLAASTARLNASKVVACLHLSQPGGAAAQTYEGWLQELPGRQVLMSGSEDGHANDIGFLSSARTLVRLNLLSPRFFPLPQGLQEFPKSAWQVLPGAAALLSNVMAVSKAQANDPEAAALAAKGATVSLGLYKAVDAALAEAPAPDHHSSQRSGVPTAETTVGKLASLLSTPSAQAKGKAIGEWDIARIIVTPLLAAISPPTPVLAKPSQVPLSNGPSSDALSSDGNPNADGTEATAMMVENEEVGDVWSADGLTVCRGALWQITGCDVEHAWIREVQLGDDPLNTGATLVQMLATHPWLAELLEQFRNEAAFQAPTNLTNHVTQAQIKACWPPWASPPTVTPIPALQPRPAITHLGKRTTPARSPQPPRMNEAAPAQPTPALQPKPANTHLGKRVSPGPTPSPQPPRMNAAVPAVQPSPALQPKPAAANAGKQTPPTTPPAAQLHSEGKASPQPPAANGTETLSGHAPKRQRTGRTAPPALAARTHGLPTPAASPQPMDECEEMASAPANLLFSNGWYMSGRLCPPTEASMMLCESLSQDQVLPTVPFLSISSSPTTPTSLPPAVPPAIPAASTILTLKPPTCPSPTPSDLASSPTPALPAASTMLALEAPIHPSSANRQSILSTPIPSSPSNAPAVAAAPTESPPNFSICPSPTSPPLNASPTSHAPAAVVLVNQCRSQVPISLSPFEDHKASADTIPYDPMDTSPTSAAPLGPAADPAVCPAPIVQPTGPSPIAPFNPADPSQLTPEDPISLSPSPLPTAAVTPSNPISPSSIAPSTAAMTPAQPISAPINPSLPVHPAAAAAASPSSPFPASAASLELHVAASALPTSSEQIAEGSQSEDLKCPCAEPPIHVPSSSSPLSDLQDACMYQSPTGCLQRSQEHHYPSQYPSPASDGRRPLDLYANGSDANTSSPNSPSPAPAAFALQLQLSNAGVSASDCPPTPHSSPVWKLSQNGETHLPLVLRGGVDSTHNSNPILSYQDQPNAKAPRRTFSRISASITGLCQEVAQQGSESCGDLEERFAQGLRSPLRLRGGAYEADCTYAPHIQGPHTHPSWQNRHLRTQGCSGAPHSGPLLPPPSGFPKPQNGSDMSGYPSGPIFLHPTHQPQLHHHMPQPPPFAAGNFRPGFTPWFPSQHPSRQGNSNGLGHGFLATGSQSGSHQPMWGGQQQQMNDYEWQKEQDGDGCMNEGYQQDVYSEGSFPDPVQGMPHNAPFHQKTGPHDPMLQDQVPPDGSHHFAGSGQLSVQSSGPLQKLDAHQHPPYQAVVQDADQRVIKNRPFPPTHAPPPCPPTENHLPAKKPTDTAAADASSGATTGANNSQGALHMGYTDIMKMAMGKSPPPIPRAKVLSTEVLKRQQQRKQPVDPAKAAAQRAPAPTPAAPHPPPPHPAAVHTAPTPAAAHPHSAQIGGRGVPNGTHASAMEPSPPQHQMGSRPRPVRPANLQHSGAGRPFAMHQSMRPWSQTSIGIQQHWPSSMRPLNEGSHDDLGGDLGPLPAGAQAVDSSGAMRIGNRQSGVRLTGPVKPPSRNKSAAAELRAKLLARGPTSAAIVLQGSKF
ncbi:hypothetical protein WJX74_005522 [Apatococcus lobatus]|uniref:ribonuclease Z n=1 Tax=Apatococcus lobatus TaxID=904363 RepID=A0AAW1QM37_9CHLO